MRNMLVTLSVVCFFAASSNARTNQSPSVAPEAPAGFGGPPQPGGNYVLDPTHTFVLYEMGHYGTSTNRGRFSTKDGLVRVDSSGSLASMEILMDMASINTGVDMLNRHLQSTDFLNIAEYPIARFSADNVRLDAEFKSVEGRLEMLGQTHPVMLRVVRFNCYISPVHNRQVCGGDFQADIMRSQWGITWGLQFGFEDRVRLLIQVEAVLVSAKHPR
ncbi:YceI family protein [Variovorax sp. HJSM1_2]|uniref:YceI family protein n=1 Tax=Variovorax sp. HJSM1_2 TaxID=3366263 RepID=UPI003BDA1F10